MLLLTNLHIISAGPQHIDYKTIDGFSSTTRAWTTAQLSVARGFASATSVGNLAMFAGGSSGINDNVKLVHNNVDIFDGVTGAWSTAELSVARWYSAATSVGNMIMFAGGSTSSGLLLQYHLAAGLRSTHAFSRSPH